MISAFHPYMTRLCLLLLLCGCMGVAEAQQTATIYGNITNEDGEVLPEANISVIDRKIVAQSDNEGNFFIKVPANDTIIVAFSYVGYLTEYKKYVLLPDQRYVEVIQLVNMVLGPVVVNPRETMRRLPVEKLKTIPYTVDPLTAILQAMGAVTNNELSSQYTIRGGNFDENLVYVNDFEIYRPMLIRSGEQEGLPFPNYDLIQDIGFSAGGFEAKYGDKLSSVLDIRYKRPREFESGATMSLLGASFYMNNAVDSGKGYYLFGTRYKTNRYLLNSLNVKGQYQPVFIDAQGLFGWHFNRRHSIEILGNFSYNDYTFIPESRSTGTGLVNDVIRLDVLFDGQEIDRFITGFAGVSHTFTPNKKTMYKFMVSGYHSLESETFDILGEYWIGQVESNLGSENYGDVIYGLGAGAFQNFARNYLMADVINVQHIGSKKIEAHFIEWGVRGQLEFIADEIHEWELLDSAGYSIPYTNSSVQLNEVYKSTISLNSTRVSGYFQDSWEPLDKQFTLIAGIRSSYWDVNKEVTLTPRMQFIWRPEWTNKRDSAINIEIKASAGLYYQPPFYRELRDRTGGVHYDVLSQKSAHFVLGSDYAFNAWNRKFRFVSEVYFKYLYDVNTYDLENVRIRYFGNNDATGFATGIDLRLHGQLVKDADSWISLSVLRTMEDIENDSTYNILLDEFGNVDTLIPVPQGYIRRPTDQLISFGMFFQDYMPGNENFKVHLSLFVGSGMPYGPPNNAYFRSSLRMPPYRRVDIGFSALLLSAERNRQSKPWYNSSFKSLWASVEVFNLLGINNTISYIWVRDVNNLQYAFPNFLTNRRLNVKLVAEF